MCKARITAEIKSHVFSTYDGCVACGTWDADECGHIVPESQGGQMLPQNFVRLCGSCNRAQGVASVVFASFASVTESRALIVSRRAYWSSYCGAARSRVKVKPYRPQE